jgi:hypothetical protein
VRKASAMPILLFIDTNIFLNYYEKVEKPGGISLLRKINKNRARIITTEQVEMEFEKNRQQVILKQLDKQANQVNKYIDKILWDPTSDGVYQILERFFRGESDYHLTNKNMTRSRIHRLAFKRFIMNYPPRKSKDTSMGDAINWEWIVYCAQQSKADVVIVSRDSDYGIRRGEHSILNDWLRHEFQERVGFDRKISLTALLSKAFKIADIPVSKKEEEEENELVEEVRKGRRIYPRFFNQEVCPRCGQDMVRTDEDFAAHQE